jgi:hypothetical protein
VSRIANKSWGPGSFFQAEPLTPGLHSPHHKDGDLAGCGRLVTLAGLSGWEGLDGSGTASPPLPPPGLRLGGIPGLPSSPGAKRPAAPVDHGGGCTAPALCRQLGAVQSRLLTLAVTLYCPNIRCPQWHQPARTFLAPHPTRLIRGYRKNNANPHLQMGKEKLREGRRPAQDHTPLGTNPSSAALVLCPERGDLRGAQL